MKTVQMITFYYPGILFSENSSKEIGHRDPYRVKMPNNAFAFSFYDKVIQTAKLENGKEIEHVEKKNESERYYPGGQSLNLTQAKQATGDNRILCSNMEANGYDRVIRTCMGNYQPFEPGKTLII